MKKKHIIYILIAGVAWLLLLSFLVKGAYDYKLYAKKQRFEHEKLNFTLLNVIFDKYQICYRDSRDSCTKYIERKDHKNATKWLQNCEYYHEQLRTVKRQQDSIYSIIQNL